MGEVQAALEAGQSAATPEAHPSGRAPQQHGASPATHAPQPVPAAAAAPPAVAANTSRTVEDAAAVAAKGAAPFRRLFCVYPLLPHALRREQWQLGQLDVVRQLHRGYASSVYRVQDHTSGIPMALKLYDTRALSQLHYYQMAREIKLHGSFVHDNVVALYAAFQEGDRVALLQEFAPEGDLAGVLRKARKRLTERGVVQVVVQPLLEALVYLHARGVTHRDIKPENILFSGDGTLKLADFGLAIDTTHEKAVTRAGTLQYMAPEVLRCPLKDHPQDNKDAPGLAYGSSVDAWAVGVLAYELVVGVAPFRAADKEQTKARINAGQVLYPPDMSDECRDFVARALQRDPQARPTALEMLHHPWVFAHQKRNSNRYISTGTPPTRTRPPGPGASSSAEAASGSAPQKQPNSRLARQPSQMAPF